jgi:lysine-specific demethylase 8
MRPSTGVHANTSTIPVAVSRFERGEVGDVPPKVFEACRADLDAAFDMPGACVADLAAGDSVLIPQGWWHSAEGGDGVGVGINAWFR